VASLLAGILPLALFFVLPLASAHHPYSDWGHPQTLSALWRHVSRAQYTELESTVSNGTYTDYLRRLEIMADWGARQFGSGWVLLLAGIGALTLLVRQTGLWLLCVVVGWLNSVGITRYTAFPFEREHIYAVQIFWIPAWMVLAWLIGGGLDALLARIARLRRPSLLRVGTATAGLACAGLVAWPAAAHFARADRSRTTLIEGFGRSILDVMEPGALYFPSSDHSTFSVLYQQGVLGHRMDVVIADKTGELEADVLDTTLTPEDRTLLATAPKANYRELAEQLLIERWKGPVYFANRRDMRDVKDLVLEPVGPIFKVMTRDEATAWWKAGEDGSPAPGLAVWSDLQPLLDADERQQLDFTVQMVRGDLLYMKGFAQVRGGDVEGAIATWSRIDGDLAPLKQEFNNIGSALAENGRPAEALTFYDRSVAEDPRYVIGLKNKALVLGTLGRSEDMIAMLRQALAAEPDQRDVRLELARKLAEVHRPTEALAEYEALALLDRDDPRAFKEAGKLMLDLGDKSKAKTLLAHALDANPHDTEVAQWLEVARQPDVAALDPALPKPGALDASAWMPDEALKDRNLAGPRLPQLPRDPALDVGFDPMRGPGHGALPRGMAPKAPRIAPPR
jgi:tetratricopeptide (TPR) repeat protein